MYDQSFKFIEVEKKDHTLWLYLNRPEASNAFTVEMIDELVNMLSYADLDSEIRCIVLSGRGKHFCAGGDVKNMLAKKEMFAGGPNELRERYKRGIQKIPMAFSTLSTPVVAMINGAAIGAGLDIACMCDIRIASEHAKFGETFTKLGLIPGDGGTYFLQRIVGFAKAMEMTLTADVYSAQDGKDMGLFSQVVVNEKLKETVDKYVDKVCANAPIAIQMAKRAITHAYRSDLQGNLDLLAAYQGITQRTSDHFNALESIKEKKEASFKHQ
jgi:2-(1,2-epoxy-1,2-dihydrophenyl)acetyl-CoA isomerase